MSMRPLRALPLRLGTSIRSFPLWERLQALTGTLNRTTKQHVPSVFIDPALSAEHPAGACDVVLSPAYYWVKRQSLPVRYLRDVKKLLPSLFDDILPEGNYRYTAYREEDAYLLFAYSDTDIFDALAAGGIAPEQLRHVYFAQSECTEALAPTATIDGTFCLARRDGIVVRVPHALAEEPVALDLEAPRSKRRVALSRYGAIADTREWTLLWSILLLGALLVGIEWYQVRQKRLETEQAVRTLIAERDLKPTMMQNETILQNMTERHLRQERLRESLALLLTLPLRRNETLLRYGVSQNRVQAVVRLSDPARVKSLTDLLRRKGAAFSHRYDKGTLTLEMEL